MTVSDTQMNNNNKYKSLLIRNKAKQETIIGHLKLLKGKKKSQLESVYLVKIYFTNESK